MDERCIDPACTYTGEHSHDGEMVLGEPGTLLCSTMLVDNPDGTVTLVDMPVPARYRYGTPEWEARHVDMPPVERAELERKLGVKQGDV